MTERLKQSFELHTIPLLETRFHILLRLGTTDQHYALIHSFSILSDSRQVQSLFQNGSSTQCDLELPLSNGVSSLVLKAIQ
jgi:hypothetical protein